MTAEADLHALVDELYGHLVFLAANVRGKNLVVVACAISRLATLEGELARMEVVEA